MPGAYVLHLNEHLDLDTTTMVCRTCRKSKNVQAFPTVTNAGGHSQDPTDHRWHRGTECRDCQAERRQKPHQVTADDLISEARVIGKSTPDSGAKLLQELGQLSISESADAIGHDVTSSGL